MSGAESSPAALPSLSVEVEGLAKFFGVYPALKSLNLKVKQGEFLTIFGPNGSGKTTLIKVLATICRPSSGTVKVAGLEVRQNPLEVKRRIGVVTHLTYLYDDLTARENLRFYGKLYDVQPLEERVKEVVARVGLSSRLDDRVGTFSRGMQQRLTLARALLHRPQILFLDEAETGLDRQSTSMLWDVLEEHRSQRGTAVMTTHSLERGLKWSDRVAILVGGKIAYEEACSSVDSTCFEDLYHRYTGAKS